MKFTQEQMDKAKENANKTFNELMAKYDSDAIKALMEVYSTIDGKSEEEQLSLSLVIFWFENMIVHDMILIDRDIEAKFGKSKDLTNAAKMLMDLDNGVTPQIEAEVKDVTYQDIIDLRNNDEKKFYYYVDKALKYARG